MHSPMASTVELEKVEVPKINEKDYAPGAVVMRITSNEKFSYSAFPDTYIKVDQQSNKNAAIDYIGLKRGFIVIDDNLKYNWKITSEIKKLKNIPVTRQLQLLEVINTKHGSHPIFHLI